MISRLVFLGCLSLGALWFSGSAHRSDAGEPGHSLIVAPPKLSEKQTEKLTKQLQHSLEREKHISPVTLKYLWQIRGAAPRTDAADAADALLLRAVAHVDPRVVMLAADALSQHRPEGAQPQLVKLHDREEFAKHFGFRRSVTDAVTAWQNMESVDFLIENLPTAKGQYQLLVVSQLMKLTGHNFADDQDKWAQWWASAKNSYGEPPDSAKNFVLNSVALADDWSHPLPEFFDVPLFAKNIVFVIDRSKSMRSSLQGETRLEIAQKELTDAIQALDGDVAFNIVAFDDNLIPWRSKLVLADELAKSDAVQFVASIYTGNRTASYNALSQSLAFSTDVELVVLLSDGKPTVGQIVEPNAIVGQITQENMFLRATIDTIGIDTVGVSETFMSDLAQNNYGTYKKIR